MRLLIKIGGTLVDDGGRRAALALQIGAAHRNGHQIVVVHGGGRQLTRFLETRGAESRFINGLRVTDAHAMDAVVKVLAGTVNKELTGALRACGVNAVGISGMDGRLTTAAKLSDDLGWVGRVVSVDPTLLDLLISARMIPVVACVGGDNNGQAWNINADRMAVACAEAFGVERLIFLTDVEGVLDAHGHAMPHLDIGGAESLIASGIARGGMEAKLRAASDALHGRVPSVVIAPGHRDGVLEALLSGGACGTEMRIV